MPPVSREIPRELPDANGSRLSGIRDKVKSSVVNDLLKLIDEPGISLENEDKYLQLSGDTVQHTWETAINYIRSYVSSAFIDVAEKAVVTWEEPATIILEVDNKLSEGLLIENKMQLSSGLRYVTGRTDFEICIILNRKYDYEVKVKKHLSPREKFRVMAEQNPALLDLQKRLDLDIL